MDMIFQELVKKTLTAFFQVVLFEDHKGYPVTSGEVRILSKQEGANGGTSSSLSYIQEKEVRFSQPLILAIKKQLQDILGYCQIFNSEGEPLALTGFRLIPRNWVLPYRGSLTDNIGSLASSCTCHCRFCYIDGNPFVTSRKFKMSRGEASLRVKYYDPVKKKGLFPVMREYLEPFANPHFLEIFQMMRRSYPDEYLTMMTNGSSLRREVIKELGKLKPLSISISLNSINPSRRRDLMGDKNSQIVLDSFSYLREEGIPFAGSIVAYQEIPLTELTETIYFLDEMEAEGIRVVLPGFTRFHSSEVAFNTNEHWPRVVALIQDLRKKITNFLILQPNAYWMKTTEPFIDGIIKNSPAARKGLRTGDRILTINGREVHNKVLAKKILAAYSFQEKTVTLKVKQGEEVKILSLANRFSNDADYYPYKPVGYRCDVEKTYGICLVESFRKEYLVFLGGLLRKYRPKKAILFISPLMRPQLEEELEKIDREYYFGDSQVEFLQITPKFWGGNIVLGDLTMVSDYIGKIKAFIEKGGRADLIIIPSSFLVDWGRDYAGEVFLEIERQTGIKVELLPCKTINL